MYSCTIGKLYSLITSAFVHEASKREVKLSRVRRYAHGRVKAVSLYDSPRFALGKGPTDSISNPRTTLFNFGKMKGRGGGGRGGKRPTDRFKIAFNVFKIATAAATFIPRRPLHHQIPQPVPIEFASSDDLEGHDLRALFEDTDGGRGHGSWEDPPHVRVMSPRGGEKYDFGLVSG